MNESITIIENGKLFSAYYFYNEFLKRVANFYSQHKDKTSIIQFSLIIEDDYNVVGNKYFIDPIVLPLLVSLAEQLKKYHGSSLNLFLSNNKATNDVLAFLERADFFHLVGSNQNPTYPLGKNILSYDKRHLGDFKTQIQRPEHKLRGYSINEDGLKEKTEGFDSERQRDYLVEHFTYKVKDHFGVLLFSNEQIQNLTYEYIDILAELITNGVLHSGSDAYTLMFTNQYKTSFSISDNGKGLYKSLEEKNTSNIDYYTKFEMFKELKKLNKLKISEQIENSLLAIFETLYYSMLKDRKGLFDLMCNVVINCNGYFRLHNENAQIIVSARMLNELNILFESRSKILEIHDNFLFKKIVKDDFDKEIKKIALETKKKFVKLATSIFDKYHIDTRYSSIRLFEVKFRGVHIEVEIPNMK